MTLAKFDKVSLQQFVQDTQCDQDTYDSIILPCRATVCSAGYDFFAPQDIQLQPQQTAKMATGIRAYMPDNWVLLILPRSGLGFKYRLRLDNTVGVIDADYVRSDNEGHIFIKVTNEGDKPLHIPAGSAFAQGIFTQYLLTEDDQVEATRNGGMGSTSK